jgi:hypothetical protein
MSESFSVNPVVQFLQSTLPSGAPGPAAEEGGSAQEAGVVQAVTADGGVAASGQQACADRPVVEGAQAHEALEQWTTRVAGVGPSAAQLPGRRRRRRLVQRKETSRVPFTAQQRLLILDSWQRSGLPAGDFAPLVGISKHTLYGWKKRFEEQGPAGLMDQSAGPKPAAGWPDENAVTCGNCGKKGIAKLLRNFV